jgi:signal transduction histidine kinase
MENNKELATAISEIEALSADLLLSRISFIEQASMSSSTSHDIHNALETVLETVLRIFRADAGALFLYNTATEKLEFVVTLGVKESEVRPYKISPGQGIAGWVFEKQQPVFSNAVNKDEPFDETVSRETHYQTDNIIAAPLTLRNKCLGVIEVINRASRRPFGLYDMQILDTLSNTIALLLENERLFERCSSQLLQRNNLLELTKVVNSRRDLPELLAFIVRTGAEMLDAEGGALLLVDGDLLRFEVAYGEKASELKKFTVPLGAGIAGSVAVSGKSKVINQTGEASGIFEDIDKGTGFITRNLLCCPLRVSDRVIGVLEVVNRREKNFYEEDVSLIEGFASQAAVAIERARLVEKRVQEERLAAIGRTVAGLTHCIKNIMNALRGGEYIAEKGFRNNDMESIRKGWDMTKSGCRRIQDLVLDMLTLSKKREPEYEDCDPYLIAKEVADLIQEKANQCNVTIATGLEDEVGVVRVDRKGIFRCLMNLVSNAVDACGEKGGMVRIETFRRKEKPFFGFRVIDNGHGITEDDQKRLFQEFFSTKGSKGTGLGLSVTYSIISGQGGRILCDSQVVKGTTFTVELPTGGGLS